MLILKRIDDWWEYLPCSGWDWRSSRHKQTHSSHSTCSGGEFLSEQGFSLDIFIWHFAFLPLLPRCLGLCWLLRIQEGWIFCHQYLFRLKSVFTLFLFHAFLVFGRNKRKRVGGVPVGDLVLPVGDRQLGGRPHSLRVLSFHPRMRIWVAKRWIWSPDEGQMYNCCKGEFHT